MNEANDLLEDQKLSWILEEYRDWAEKNQYEFITAHNGRMALWAVINSYWFFSAQSRYSSKTKDSFWCS